ncbi:hypothetical protein ACH4L5_17440 [Streptomyces sp. NPDC017405]|uniref:hypothetical protein n=1 Tax=unclassified Streptomyces TaxID=2593676 RepID=UPI0037B29CCE
MPEDERVLLPATVARRQLPGAALATIVDLLGHGAYSSTPQTRLHALAPGLGQTIGWHRFDHEHHAAANRHRRAAVHAADLARDSLSLAQPIGASRHETSYFRSTSRIVMPPRWSRGLALRLTAPTAPAPVVAIGCGAVRGVVAVEGAGHLSVTRSSVPARRISALGISDLSNRR